MVTTGTAQLRHEPNARNVAAIMHSSPMPTTRLKTRRRWPGYC
jgi:hypothetical protein